MEEDALDKEIASWKKACAEPAASRSNEPIEQLYHQSVRPLFDLLIKRHEQFNELFGECEILLDISGKGGPEEHTNCAFPYNRSEPESTWKAMEPYVNAFLKRIGITYQLKHFQREGINAFNQLVRLDVSFNNDGYLISSAVSHSGGSYGLKRLHTEQLKAEEIQTIVRIIVRYTFEGIKHACDEQQ